MLAFLLHHANRSTKDPAFYKIKDALLKKYAVEIGYDVQHIAGKQCYSCGGTGIHHKYGHNGKPYDTVDCYHCWGGWFKMPQWIALQSYAWDHYRFHRPLKREFCEANPFAKESLDWEVGPIIEGYIEHSESKYSYLAVYALFLLYDRSAFRMRLLRWWSNLGFGWYVHWWRPRHWLNNVKYIVRTRSIPHKIRYKVVVDYHTSEEEMPF